MNPLSIKQRLPLADETRLQGSWRDTDLPHACFFAINKSHIVNLVPLDVQPLRLVQLLRNKTHKGVVWGVGCQGQTNQSVMQSYKV